MFRRFRIKRQRSRRVGDDRRYLEVRVRRFLRAYQSATGTQKNRYYDVVAGASAACHSEHDLSRPESATVADMTAKAASAVVRRRTRVQKISLDDRMVAAHIDGFITDAYATAAVAYGHAAGVYVDDDRMQSLGSEARHLLTTAISRASSKDGSADACLPPWQRLAQSVAKPPYENS